MESKQDRKNTSDRQEGEKIIAALSPTKPTARKDSSDFYKTFQEILDNFTLDSPKSSISTVADAKPLKNENKEIKK